MTDVYQTYGLKQVINASGKMKILGVSKVSDWVLEAQKFGGQNFFEMSDLVLKTGQHLAKLIGAEDGVILASASAAIAESVAALIGAGSLHHLYHPFDKRYTKREIIIPKGQNVDYVTPESLMIELGGGEVVEAGYANICSPEHVEMMITEQTVAIFYVKSHHAVQKSMLTISEALEIARKHNLPLILDAAAEEDEDLKKYVAMGVDIVIYSGAKAFSRPSSALVLGKKPYFDWIRLQGKGIGRAMNIGKDNILGLTQAIEDYLEFGPEDGDSMKKRLEPFVNELNRVNNIEAKVEQDSAGRDIYRASVTVARDSPITAKNLIAQLKETSPAVYTREYPANIGVIEFDIRAVH